MARALKVPSEAVVSSGVKVSSERRASLDPTASGSPRNEKAVTGTGKPTAKTVNPPKPQKKWSGPYLWTNKNSPLEKPEFLRAMLLNSQAWDVLDLEAKKSILAKLPNEKHILEANTDATRPDFVKLTSNDRFRHDCARYLAHMQDGMHEPKWLRQAWIAQQKHKQGRFDEFMNNYFKGEYTTTLPGEEPNEDDERTNQSAEDRSHKNTDDVEGSERQD
ncbi:Asx homology domain-containing protein [Podospora fimiseda]|uniref:Asx homology domain-containing protein n=1 Tax=Podospora fimiseda TaxID=252190 RepID=A0AAN7BVG0_9PEZI|nr:Asx homology domain-containing protein [Podospora fimiseda]